jgi:hypothetical protein
VLLAAATAVLLLHDLVDDRRLQPLQLPGDLLAERGELSAAAALEIFVGELTHRPHHREVFGKRLSAALLLAGYAGSPLDLDGHVRCKALGQPRRLGDDLLGEQRSLQRAVTGHRHRTALGGLAEGQLEQKPVVVLELDHLLVQIEHELLQRVDVIRKWVGSIVGGLHLDSLLQQVSRNGKRLLRCESRFLRESSTAARD